MARLEKDVMMCLEKDVMMWLEKDVMRCLVHFKIISIIQELRI